MATLVLELIVGALILFVVPIFMPEYMRQNKINALLVRGLGALIIVYAILSTSYVNVGDGRFAQLFRTIGGGPLEGGKILAINGENGPQAQVLRPGFHARFLLNVFYAVDTSKKETEIPPGKIGVLTAKDGTPLRAGQAFADPFPANKGMTMLDADTFLRNGGQRGPQLTILPPGKYVLNDYLWVVSIRDASDVDTGFVGVVKSNVWANVELGTLRADKPDNCSVIGGGSRSEGKIEAPIVPVGCVGVWQASLQPGKYYFNPDAFTIIPIDTRAQVWTYSGGYPRCEITLTVDSKGDITQNRQCTAIPIAKDNADRAVFVKMEGWDVPLELRVVAQVSPSEASCVVAGVGTLREIEDRVLTPSIRAITRDVAGGTYDVEEPKTDETGKPVLVDGKPVIQRLKRPTKVLDLINQRPLIESEIERRIRPEGEKSCVTIREVRLGEPAIPPELLVAVRREQLATQLAKAYVQEQAAQTKRIDSEKAKATADQQPELVKAEIAVQTSQQKALALKNEGQGEKDKLELIALGQKAQTEVLGVAATVQLQQYNILMDKLFGFANANPRVLELALTNAGKFVPNTYVGGGDGMFGALLGKLLSGGDVAPQPGNRPAAR
jgi:SPFH domain / Band 7 family